MGRARNTKSALARFKNEQTTISFVFLHLRILVSALQISISLGSLSSTSRVRVQVKHRRKIYISENRLSVTFGTVKCAARKVTTRVAKHRVVSSPCRVRSHPLTTVFLSPVLSEKGPRAKRLGSCSRCLDLASTVWGLVTSFLRACVRARASLLFVDRVSAHSHRSLSFLNRAHISSAGHSLFADWTRPSWPRARDDCTHGRAPQLEPRSLARAESREGKRGERAKRRKSERSVYRYARTATYLPTCAHGSGSRLSSRCRGGERRAAGRRGKRTNESNEVHARPSE